MKIEDITTYMVSHNNSILRFISDKYFGSFGSMINDECLLLIRFSVIELLSVKAKIRNMLKVRCYLGDNLTLCIDPLNLYTFLLMCGIDSDKYLFTSLYNHNCENIVKVKVDGYILEIINSDGKWNIKALKQHIKCKIC